MTGSRGVAAMVRTDENVLPSATWPTTKGWPAGRGAHRRSVCLYTPSADPSGMGGHMLDLAAEFVADADVTLMAWPTVPGRRLLDGADALGAVPVALPHPRDPRFAAEIRQFLRERPVDVFHIHVGTGRENFDGARAARAAGVPAVVQTQHLPWLMGSPKHRVPFFRGLAAVDHVITVSYAQRRTYEKIGVPAGELSTVPNGIRERGPGLGRLRARRELGLDPDQRVVLTVGRLTVAKGQRYLVAAVPDLARRFPDLAVVLIGQGHLADQLRAQAAAAGVGDRVHLAGHRSDARMLLDAADVFVLPSRSEGMPLALLEAMDAGVPVVATRVIGSEEVVEEGVTGFVVPRESPAALGAALGRVLEDRALREQLGRAGRRRYVQHFTSARMAAQTAAVYDHVLQRTGNRAWSTAGGSGGGLPS